MLDLNERLAASVAAHPRRTAVWAGSQRLTYAELDEAVQRAASVLDAAGIRAGTRVALQLPPGPELMVVLLAVLRSGAAYVPLDPAEPGHRMKLILDDARPMAIVDGGAVGTAVTDTTRLRILDAAARSAAPADPLDRTAYIIYTSGTTGVPKGVPVSHRNVGALLHSTDEHFDFRADDRWLLFHAVTFDFSVWEIWGALAHGAALCVPERWSVMEPRAAARLIADEGITVLNQTPSAFAAVSAELLRSAPDNALRYVVFGGERLLPASLRSWAERIGLNRVALVNLYGITEVTVHATLHRLTDRDLKGTESVIGAPLSGFAAQVVDERDQPAARGELLLAGPQVVGGYLNRPELDEHRFVLRDGRRYYRSGDIVERGPDGLLRYLGRTDDQVKVRGYRIELSEVEHALSSVPGVAASCALTLPDGHGGLLLAGTYSTADGAVLTTRQVRATLRTALPLHMVPTKLKQVPALPRTANGKVDRAALRDAWDGPN
ncbi:amino acid adenylation domain-containing protein [Streptomyces sp. NPDC012474]|uniref:amino acid adenylation domain-containing protein n=1 Tax=Streptomyces sp. NPDC012474 TaxID=3364836 RepID=UPI0036ECAC9E